MATRPKMRRRRRTKIIATLGPASASLEVVTRLFQAGADVFRLNFSHGTHEDHAARFAMIRQLEERFDRPIGILADVQGPKLRVGTLLRRTRVPADRPAVPARSQRDAWRCLAREPAASGDHRGGLDRLLAAAGRRQAAAARGAQARRCTGDRGGRRRSAVGPQGRQRAGRRAADPGADRQGPRSTWRSRWSTAPTTSACRSCSGRRMWRRRRR